MGYLRQAQSILWEAVTIALVAESRRCMAAELEVTGPADTMWSGCLMHSKCAGIFPCSLSYTFTAWMETQQQTNAAAILNHCQWPKSMLDNSTPKMLTAPITILSTSSL